MSMRSAFSWRSLSSLLSLITIVATCSTNTASAAEEFRVASCNSIAKTSGLSRQGWDYLGSVLITGFGASQCPTGLSFDTQQERRLGDWQQWRYDVPSAELKLKRVRFVSRAEAVEAGIIYEVAACGSCEPLATISDGETRPTELGHDVALDDTSEFVIRARCEHLVCANSSGLRMNDFEITVTDSVPPWMNLTGVGLTGNNPWVGPAGMRVRASSMDQGSGVLNGEMSLDGLRIGAVAEDSLQLADCRQFVAFHESIQPCQSFPRLTEIFIPTDGLDGDHVIRAVVADLVGNRAESEYRFRVDRTPPEGPSNLRVMTVNEHGWSKKPNVDLAWDLTGEVTGNAERSGLASLKYSISQTDQTMPSTPVTLPSAIAIEKSFAALNDGLWTVDIWGVDAVGNVGRSKRIHFGVDTTSPATPTLYSSGWVSREQLITGYYQHWERPLNIADLESGICGYVLRIFGDETSVPSESIDLIGDITSTRLWPDAVEGPNNWVKLRAISCSGRSSETASTRLKVDASPPKLRISAPPEQHWSSSPVTVVISAEDALSGVASIHYKLLDGPTKTVSGDSVALSFEDGIHELVYSAIDATGNKSSVQTRALHVDSAGPEAWLEQRDPADPTLISALVRDRLSGVARASIEFRRVESDVNRNESSWHAMESQDEAAFGENQLRVSARIADDELVEGAYEFRVVAADRARNLSVSTVGASGSSLSITLPVRLQTTTSIGIARVHRMCLGGRTVCVNDSRCRAGEKCKYRIRIERKGALPHRVSEYAQRMVLVGDVADAYGDPVAGSLVRVLAQAKGGEPESVASITTAENGKFEYAIPSGSSRRYFARFTGNKLIGRSEGSATLQVRAAVSIQPSRRQFHSGESVIFSGRLASGGTGIPIDGKGYLLQYWNRDRWSSVDFEQFAADGTFSIAYPFTRPVEHRTRILFRVMVNSESGWPFAAGASSATALTLLPTRT